MKKAQISALAWMAVAVLAAPSALAATNSWNSNPSWASANTAPTENRAPRRLPAREARKNNLSPFAPESNNVSLAVGQVFLMGDLSNYSDSIGTELHYTYGVSDMFGFNAALGRSSHSDGRYSQTTLTTGLRANLSWFDKVVPYAILGLGFYKPRVEIDDTQSLSPLLFGVHFGPGIDLQITRELFFGAGLTFHDIFGSEQKLQNGKVQNVGGTYTTFLVHAGVTF